MPATRQRTQLPAQPAMSQEGGRSGVWCLGGQAVHQSKPAHAYPPPLAQTTCIRSVHHLHALPLTALPLWHPCCCLL